MYEFFVSVIGTPPPGYEPLAYVGGVVVFIILFDTVIDFIRSFRFW